ncbi:MAG: energy transducer TonB [Rhodospirillaceae bacterium]|nr:energy transducer TonB [Rhodospirillaceae bacterium]
MRTTFQFNRAFLGALGLCFVFGLAACGDGGKGEVKAVKEAAQRAFGEKDIPKFMAQAKKGLEMSLKVNGPKAPDTLYFVQAISEANLAMRNARGAIAALKQELEMRAAAGQDEQKLQKRRTLLIQLAEENGDTMTAVAQAVLVSRGIGMGQGKDPQRVYQTMCQYPPDQYRQGIEGDVDVSYSLDSGGAVTSASVAKATPPQVFDQAALECFKKWRFTPMLDSNRTPRSASGFTFTVAFRMK